MGSVRGARAAVCALWLVACAKVPVAVAPPVAEDALVTALRTRAVPDPLQARFVVKIASEKLKITAPPLGGGLIVDRPGRAYLAVMSPVGGVVLSVTTDGAGAAMMNARDKQWVVADDAASLLGSAASGTLNLDDLVGLLLGQLPISEGSVRSRESVEGGVQIVAAGPGKTTITALVDPETATPKRVTVTDADGNALVEASYEPFAPLDASLLPTALSLHVVPVDLHLDLRFKSWRTPEEIPDVFGLAAPEGFQVLTFQEYAAAMATANEAGDTAP
jgi:hypothetical protein